MQVRSLLVLLLLAGCNRFGSERLSAEAACQRLTEQLTSPATCQHRDRGGIGADATQRVDLVPDPNRPSSFHGAMVLSFDDQAAYKRSLENASRGGLLVARGSERAGIVVILPGRTSDDLVDAVRDALAKL